MVGAVRPDKTKRAAAHRFKMWYKEGKASTNEACYHCHLQDSPLYADMKRTPHKLLYFLLNVLQRLVDQFWQSSAASEPYVTMCVAAMTKCPPCIIGLLVYLRSPELSPATVFAFPPSSKDRIFWSELARATARSEEHREPEECENIARAYQVYATKNIFADISLSLSAVVTEVRLTMQVFAQQKLWPSWLLRRNDKALENMPETDDAYVDPGNEVWEVLVNLMGLSSAIASLRQQQRFNYNFRGNDLERLLDWLYEEMQKGRTEVPAKRRRKRRGC